MSILLDGKRLILSRMQVSDVTKNYCNWMNDKEVTCFLESRFYSHSIDSLREYVCKLQNDPNELLFAILLKENKRHIGNIKLGPINWIHHFAEIGLMIGEKDFWGRGYASEAIQIITEYAFDTLGLNKLIAGCYELNKGSLKAFQKAGFGIEGVHKKHFLYDGRYIDSIRLGLNKR